MTNDPAARIGALEEMLTKKGIIDAETVERILSYFETQVGPMIGARSSRGRGSIPRIKQRLLADGTAAIAELGIGGLEADHIVAVENTPEVHNVVVCTLCSCYPWAVLGLPPTWYKSPEYRSRMVREPRTVLAEMGLDAAAGGRDQGLGLERRDALPRAARAAAGHRRARRGSACRGW